jgi:hypothetical protein
VFLGRIRIVGQGIVERWACPPPARRMCLELALEKLRIDTKEKRQKDYEDRKKGGKT